MVKKFSLMYYFVSLMSFSTAAQPPAKVKAVVFDFGGVIATTDRVKIIQFLMDTFPLSKEKLKPVLGKWKQVLGKGILRQIEVPTLIIHGDQEPAVLPRFAISMSREIPEAQLEFIKGMGHMFFSKDLEDKITTAHAKSI